MRKSSDKQADTVHRAGGVMIAGAFVLALALLSMLFASRLERQRNPNASPDSAVGADGSTEVSLRANRQGHYLTNGRINGRDVVFLIDTGATTIAVPQAVADRVGLIRGSPVSVMTAAGPAQAYATRIESAGIGDIELSDLLATINPRMPGDEVLLGMSFLKTLEFSQRGDTLILRQFAPR